MTKWTQKQYFTTGNHIECRNSSSVPRHSPEPPVLTLLAFLVTQYKVQPGTGLTSLGKGNCWKFCFSASKAIKNDPETLCCGHAGGGPAHAQGQPFTLTAVKSPLELSRQRPWNDLITSFHWLRAPSHCLHGQVQLLTTGSKAICSQVPAHWSVWNDSPLNAALFQDTKGTSRQLLCTAVLSLRRSEHPFLNPAPSTLCLDLLVCQH